MTMNQQHLEQLERALIGPSHSLEASETEPPMFPRRYAEDDDAVTRLLDEALEQDEWWVAVSPEERCTLTTARVSAGLWSGELGNHAWVWREGMASWAPVTEVPQFALIAALPPAPTPPPFELDEPIAEEGPEGGLRGVVMGLSATAIVALFVTMYAISAGAGGTLP
jgi:uncharacterized protein DUF4339